MGTVVLRHLDLTGPTLAKGSITIRSGIILCTDKHDKNPAAIYLSVPLVRLFITVFMNPTNINTDP